MTSPQAAQSYATHVRKLPSLYLGASVVALAGLIGATVEIVRHPSLVSLTLLLIALAAGLGVYYARVNALRVQDRVIRLEERLRYARLLPEELQERAEGLSFDQIAALRFASDDELRELVRAVLDEGLASRDAIKRRVRDWRGDWFRV